MDQFNTPILFLIFNRPDVTRRVFEVIKEARPGKLYIAADGYRKNKPGEDIVCENVKKYIVENIDWPCEVRTLFREVNLGCKVAVSTAITWFFEQEEKGIILEDDCLPDISFFSFCEMLLEKYKNEDAIMHIGGTNFQDGTIRGEGSYYFSRMIHIWGWATWRRAWNQYDIHVTDLEKVIDNFDNIFPDRSIKKFFKTTFEKVRWNKIDTWDYQWQYSIWRNEGFSIIPNVNLISNIGFGNNATHTRSQKSEFANMAIFSINKLVHPTKRERSYSADIYSIKKILTNNGFINRYVHYLKYLIKKLLPGSGE